MQCRQQAVRGRAPDTGPLQRSRSQLSTGTLDCIQQDEFIKERFLSSVPSLTAALSLSVEPCSQTQINGRNTSTGAFNSRPWKTGSVFKTSVHLYPPDLRSESVLPRERSARGGRRRETHIRDSERFNSHMHVMSYECCTGFLITTDLQTLTCSPTGHSADGSQRDMLIVQCALQMLPKARSLTTDFSIFPFQTTVSE